MTERSLLAFESYKTAQEKFDYFVLGVIGASCAYLSQSIVFKPLGINSSTLELISLLVILLSGIFGFKRIEAIVVSFQFNHHILHLKEKKGKLVKHSNSGPLINVVTGDVMSEKEALIEVLAIEQHIPSAEKDLAAYQSIGKKYYYYRNILLLFGFLLILASKVWGAYA